jgi:23S rRNA pseudoU1915 N3-methylase RlmH
MCGANDHENVAMKPITVVLPWTPSPFFEALADRLSGLPLVSRVLVVSRGDVTADGCGAGRTVLRGALTDERTLNAVIGMAETSHLLFVLNSSDLALGPFEVDKLMTAAMNRKAGIVYSDFYEEGQGERSLHPVNDYRTGSVREGFDFGPVMLVSTDAVKDSRSRYGTTPGARSAALYDLRLKISIDYPIYRIPEPLVTVVGRGGPLTGERLFSYVDSRNIAAQREMEQVFTEYLKRIDAYLPPSGLKPFEVEEDFPAEASVVIPVKNRKGTVGDAVRSALSQETDFPFNVIVVDNHSTDGTTDLLARLAEKDERLRHLIPKRVDLGIGGCWNVAIDAESCGRYAVQLDSDDLYGDSSALQRMVEMFRQERYGMVIGAYTLVDSDLNEVPPGLVDHREWTDENGHNNALRVNGLGAPRAFATSLIRRVRFPDVSYGEDYSAALRICRDYRIGRIFDSLYLCRRWTGNTDSLLSIEEANRHDEYKDSLRTGDIAARQSKNRGVGHGA